MIERRTDAWGRTIFDPSSVFELMLRGTDISTLAFENSALIAEYNEWCSRFDKSDFLIEMPPEPERTPEEEHAERSATWLISDEMKAVNVRQFLLTMCTTDEQRDRVNDEMDLFEERKLEPLLQLMLFLVDSFRQNGIVWGVGRGSSVASYVLYLIGVHKIDPIRYGLDVRDFLK